jgi:PAS domain S-box-containing protein
MMRLRLQSQYTALLLTLTAVIVTALASILFLEFGATERAMREASDATLRATLLAQAERSARGTSAHLAETLVNPLYRWDMGTVAELVESMAKQNGILYVRLFDAQSVVLIDGTGSWRDYGQSTGNELAQRAVATKHVQIDMRQSETLEIANPIFIGSKPLGSVVIGVSLAQNEQDMASLQAALERIGERGQNQRLVATIVAALGFTAAAMLLSLSVARRMSRPIAQLSAAMQRIGRGDYTGSMRLQRNDELGDLALAMDEMAQTLKTTTVSKAYLDNVLASMLDPLLVARMDGSIETANQAAGRLIGSSAAGLIGQPVGHILHDVAGIGGPFDVAMIDQHGIGGEGVLVSAAGWRVPVLVSCSVKHETAAERRFVIALRDITDRKKAEDELREAHRQLKEAVDKLMRQERLATIGQVAASVSHELRNPLAVIRNSAFVLRQLTTGAETGIARPVDRIDRNVERCARIIDEMLDFARTPTLDLREVDADAWVAAQLDEYDLDESVVLSTELESNALVGLDGERFRRVIVNLMDNAVQAMTDRNWVAQAETRRAIEVRTRAVGGRVEIAVADSGPGIESSVQAKVFEPLFSTKSFGVGLGLPTVRQIVEQHGGAISVDSQVGRGTEFVISLPSRGTCRNERHRTVQ